LAPIPPPFSIELHLAPHFFFERLMSTMIIRPVSPAFLSWPTSFSSSSYMEDSQKVRENLPMLIVFFFSKSTPIRDRMARVFALAHAHAPISHPNAHHESLLCVREFPERTSRSLWSDSSGSETSQAVSIKVAWHSIVCAG
jgi:hypothetical protein